MVAVADSFDAVTSKRSYREPLDRHKVLELLASASGQGLDPYVLGVDLPRFVASGRLHELPATSDAGGLVHEPAPGERMPVDDVDTHAEEPHGYPHPDTRPDPHVAPPLEP